MANNEKLCFESYKLSTQILILIMNLKNNIQIFFNENILNYGTMLHHTVYTRSGLQRHTHREKVFGSVRESVSDQNTVRSGKKTANAASAKKIKKDFSYK